MPAPGREPLVGVLGGGQLGRMLGFAAARLGVRCRFLDPSRYACARSAGELVVGRYDDEVAVASLAEGCDVVTFEFENVPAATLRLASQHAPVHPSIRALETAQDRLRERELFAGLGIAHPEFTPVDSLEALEAAARRGPLPVIVKARRMGYDGKGQFLLMDAAEAPRAWDAIGRAPAIVDRFVQFGRELSVIAARGLAGEGDARTVFYPLTENVHRGGILRLSRAPAPNVSEDLERQATDAARAIMESLDYVGVLAVEFFESEGRLLANEIAPRVHNSGHWTIEGARTSQFENHVRAVLGRSLGPTDAFGYSAMVNLIGELPRAGLIESVPGAHAHVYGKEPRPGRKVGHVTLRSDTSEGLSALLERFTRIIA